MNCLTVESNNTKMGLWLSSTGDLAMVLNSPRFSYGLYTGKFVYLLFGTGDTIRVIVRDLCTKENREKAAECLTAVSTQDKPLRMKRMIDICISKLNCFQKLPPSCQSKQLKHSMKSCTQKTVVNFDAMKDLFIACLPRKLNDKEEKKMVSVLRHVHYAYRRQIRRFSEACESLYDHI
ncbi:unnamed protein product [Soboliphyme baturini]|uniref:DUF1891 domain-containing protein n=1 Tax=Soboliphyme baturini TaxID=241478 RepID=A0A183ILS8_9BILA|nr:unnamed protein product [Soboliphyme baturini]